MKKKMILITCFLFVLFIIFLLVLMITKLSIMETITITIGITLYHFVMRLLVGTIIDLIMKNRANYKNMWFREKCFEKKLYDLMRVRVWKKYLPTYSPDTFDTSKKTIIEIIGSTCQAEIVHEVIMVLSLLPIIFIPILGGISAVIVTSILAMLFDALFVILQRYNRIKLIKVMNRFQKIKNN